MDIRGRTIGSENPNEVGNPAVLLKGLEDVPKGLWSLRDHKSLC